MNTEPKTKSIGPRRRLCRNGKIARLPHDIREELNQRLQDGESGRGLVKWLNELPKVKTALKREFGGCVINEQNLSDWKQGGYRDWVAKVETDELMADTLGQGLGPEEKSSSRASTSRRKEFHEKTLETVSDKVARWFFPHYVAAARGQLAAARTPAERWSVLRTVCADLASLRRSDHYMERLRIWREKLQLETGAAQKEITEKEFVKWARTYPEVEKLIWPDREWLTPEDREERVKQILGISSPVSFPGKSVPTGEDGPESAPK